MKLYFVRHGQSTGNVGGTLMGQSDHPLTALGEAQARAAAVRLVPLGPMPLYCSDLPRARATAEHILAAWPPRATSGGVPDAAADDRLRLHADARLREIDLGDYEGRSWEEFEADERLTAAFADDPYCTVLPNGESLADLVTRVLEAVHEILRQHGDAPDRDAGSDASASATGLAAPRPTAAVCIVSHDGPIRAVLNHCLGVPPEKWWTLSTTHGGVSLVEFADGWINVRFVNATSHLEGIGAGV